MIVLTGDLHHQTLRTGNQEHCPISEIAVARRFLALLEERDIRVTFFVSGKAAVEQWDELEPIAKHPLVELGGHNWSCLTPTLLHRVSNKLVGSYNGPAWVQRLDARRTSNAIYRRTGKRIRAWRNHMYMHGPFTEEALSGAGIDVCCDGAQRDSSGPEWDQRGLYNWPINVIPDHEHIYHAERTRAWVANWQQRYNWSDDWGPESYDIDDWVNLVLADLERNAARGAPSQLIIHPITMFLCDRFDGVERILDAIAKSPTSHVSEFIDAMQDGQSAERCPEAPREAAPEAAAQATVAEGAAAP